MLYIEWEDAKGNRFAAEWHVGKRAPVITRHNVVHFHADGDELSFLKSALEGGIAEVEREACAKTAESLTTTEGLDHMDETVVSWTKRQIANAIRSRK